MPPIVVTVAVTVAALYSLVVTLAAAVNAVPILPRSGASWKHLPGDGGACGDFQNNCTVLAFASLVHSVQAQVRHRPFL